MTYAEGDPARLGRELLSARSAARRSLRNIGTAAEISAAYLQKLERGQVVEPSPRILRRLASVLGIDYQRLMVLAGYEVSPGRRTHNAFDARLADANLTQAEERAVAAFIDHLVSRREG